MISWDEGSCHIPAIVPDSVMGKECITPEHTFLWQQSHQDGAVTDTSQCAFAQAHGVDTTTGQTAWRPRTLGNHNVRCRFMAAANAPLRGDGDSGDDIWGQGAYENSLYLPLNFAVSLKLSLKEKSSFKKCTLPCKKGQIHCR